MFTRPIGPTFDNSPLGVISKPFSNETVVTSHVGTTVAAMARSQSRLDSEAATRARHAADTAAAVSKVRAAADARIMHVVGKPKA